MIAAEDIHRAFLQAGRAKHPKALKVTTEFWHYLEAKCKPEVVLVNSVYGFVEQFMGIPVFVDDEIDHPYYEFVF